MLPLKLASFAARHRRASHQRGQVVRRVDDVEAFADAVANSRRRGRPTSGRGREDVRTERNRPSYPGRNLRKLQLSHQY